MAEGRERELSTLCSQGALFVIPRTALRPGTKTFRGRFDGDMRNGRVKRRFVAAEVARDVRHDVHTGTPALKAVRMIVCLCATRDGRHRPRSIAFYDIVAAFVHASIDEVLPAVEGALRPSNEFKTVAATLHESAQKPLMDCEQNDAWFLPPPRPCWNGCYGDDFMAEGSDALLDRLNRVLTEVKFLKRTLRWHEQEMCFSWSAGTRYVTEPAVLLTKDTNSGNECNWRRRSRCPAAAGYLSGSNLPLGGGIDRPGQT